MIWQGKSIQDFKKILRLSFTIVFLLEQFWGVSPGFQKYAERYKLYIVEGLLKTKQTQIYDYPKWIRDNLY